jgi:hypothetical protein
MSMNRHSMLPALAVLVGVCAVVAYGNCRRCRSAADAPANPRQPLQTWENEGGGLSDAAAPKPAQPAPPEA